VDTSVGVVEREFEIKKTFHAHLALVEPLVKQHSAFLFLELLGLLRCPFGLDFSKEHITSRHELSLACDGWVGS
jgi:hypothetical protein